MPRKKKGDNRGSSPEKVTQTGLTRVGQQYGGGTSTTVWSEVAKRGTQVGPGPSPDQEKTYFELQEMFKGVDGEVIFMVLAESDWKGTNTFPYVNCVNLRTYMYVLCILIDQVLHALIVLKRLVGCQFYRKPMSRAIEYNI